MALLGAIVRRSKHAEGFTDDGGSGQATFRREAVHDGGDFARKPHIQAVGHGA
jgi:hypothetical protein